MRTTGWRKIATAVWGWPRDPQIYGRVELDARPILRAVEVLRARSGARVTVTHLVVRALGLALRDSPSINTRLVFGRFRPRDAVDVFVIVSTGAGKDLSGVKVTRVDEKGAGDIAREIEERAGGIRGGRGAEIERGKGLLAAMPYWLLRIVLRVAAFLTSDLGLNLRRLGLPRDAFGSAMVTSVGMFGVPEGFAPLSPMYRVPLIVLVGEVERRPWADGDSVSVQPALTVTATIDHRWADGHGLAALGRTFRAYLADPLAFEDLPEIPAATGSP
ncbi:MAG: 2-oxo acid dehydrogenase subunit E2 [Acidobacteria bacterium]|nr:2-oxo acid dehydrogenase subunit E2 [Acidobacteriota bacterium]